MAANNREAFLNERMSSTNVAFTSQQQNPMSMMFQRPMNPIPMMGGGMPMISMNPVAMAMGMGMNGFSPMGAMNGMNMMAGMAGANTMNNMANMGAMRFGMGPMGAGTSMGPVGMGIGNSPINSLTAMNMGVRGLGGRLNPNVGRMGMNASLGPARLTSRGQHSFHPYAR
jgi:RNA-binding protein Musashi